MKSLSLSLGAGCWRGRQTEDSVGGRWGRETGRVKDPGPLRRREEQTGDSGISRCPPPPMWRREDSGSGRGRGEDTQSEASAGNIGSWGSLRGPSDPEGGNRTEFRRDGTGMPTARGWPHRPGAGGTGLFRGLDGWRHDLRLYDRTIVEE